MTEEFTDLTFCDCLIFAFIHLFIHTFPEHPLCARDTAPTDRWAAW